MPEWLFSTKHVELDLCVGRAAGGEDPAADPVVYFFLVAVLRVFGKRELAQLNPFDLVVLLSLSNTVQNAIIGNDNSLTGGLVGAFALLAINYLVVRFPVPPPAADQLFEGEAARWWRTASPQERAGR